METKIDRWQLFYEWLLKCKNVHTSNNERMLIAFEKID